MEDYLIREIDRIGEMMMQVARRLGLLDGDTPDYSLPDVQEEFSEAGCPIDLDELLRQDNPVLFLAKTVQLSDKGLESFIEILFHSDLEEDKKEALLKDALAYLDGKGSFSFKLHSLCND